MLSGNSLRQTVYTHCASVHRAAKLVAALLRVVGVTAGLAESNGNLPPGLWLTSPAGWLPRTGISFGTLRSIIEYGLPLPFYIYIWTWRGRVCMYSAAAKWADDRLLCTNGGWTTNLNAVLLCRKLILAYCGFSPMWIVSKMAIVTLFS